MTFTAQKPAHRITRTAAAIALLGMLAGCATAKPDLAAPTAPAENAVALYRDQGWSALEAGRHQDAIKAFGQIARLMPADADAHLGLGEAHLGQNKLEAALDHFAKAEKIEGPGSPRPYPPRQGHRPPSPGWLCRRRSRPHRRPHPQ